MWVKQDGQEVDRGNYHPATTYSTQEELTFIIVEACWNHHHQRGPQMFVGVEAHPWENHQSQLQLGICKAQWHYILCTNWRYSRRRERHLLWWAARNSGRNTIPRRIIHHGRTKGEQRLGYANDIGDRLTTFCKENRLVIGGTIFQHGWAHIDHIIINNRWRGSLKDAVARRGVEDGG